VLKKVLIGLLAVVILAGGAVGYEAYQIYQGANSIVGFHHPSTNGEQACATHSPYAAYPQLLPWTDGSSPTSPEATATAAAAKAVKPCLDPENTDPSLTGTGRINILLLGTDNDCKFNSSAMLTQTDFIVTIDPVHHKVGMLSIPRDSYLLVPGFGYHKMDEAFSVGEQASTSTDPNTVFLAGVNTAESTIEYNFGIHIRYFGWVGLNGFVNVINTLHGVDINAIHPIVDDSYPGDSNGGGCYGYSRVFIPGGPQFMDGLIALEYVRSRHSDLSGDFGRGQRQLQLMVALRPKIDSLGLTDFGTLSTLVGELKGTVKSDVGLKNIGSFISFAKGLQLAKIHKLELDPPYYSSTSVINGEDVVDLDWSTVQPAVDKMFAPIVVKPKVRHHFHPVYVTATQAAVYLSQVSGARKQPPVVSTQNYSGPLNGSIYFVAGGNVFRFSSSGVQQVTHTTAISSATITSNGHKLAYYRRWSQNNADVWTKNLETGVSKQVTFGHNGDGNLPSTTCDPWPFCAYVWNVDPVVSPDGRQVIYSSDAYKDVAQPLLTVNDDCGTAPYNGGIDLALYDYNVETATATQSTAPCWGAGGDEDVHFDPAKSSQVVYTEYYYIQNSSNVGSRLVVLNLKTGNRWRLTPYNGTNMQAAWSPDGSHMAWLGSHIQSTTLYLAPYSRGHLLESQKRVVDRGLISEPEFSPDGKQLVYFKLDGSNFDVWIVNLRNGVPVGHPMRLFSRSELTTTSPLDWIK
jgi:LCP family protein required for cell wall assembly